MTLRLNSTGGGYIEIDAPNTASNFSLTAPIATGTLDRLERTGNILQVVSNQTATETTITTTSFSDIGLSENITSKQANSKFLILASLQYRVFRNTADTGTSIQLLRNENGGSFSGLVTDGNDYAMGYCSAISSNLEMSYRSPFNYLDSPNVASGTVLSYKIQGRVRGGPSNAVHFQDDNYYVSSLTILEIAA